MSFKEVLYKEYGKENVEIEYPEEKAKDTINLRILSKDGKNQFKGEIHVLEDKYFNLAGKIYLIEEFISILNKAFSKR